MVVGADASDDRAILQTSVSLYRRHRLKRVYYSAFSPIPHASPRLPARAAPLMREHRLYQADWLMRFYGFEEQELVTPGGMLSLTMDPKLTWALAHPGAFPVDINRAAREVLLRVPGLGATSVQRLLAARRVRTLRRADIERLGTEAARVLCFVHLPDHRPQPQALQAWLQRRFGDEGEGDGEGAGLPRPVAAAAAPAQRDLFE
jgi:predicted DNA-binding helix-hairpin-helix protein